MISFISLLFPQQNSLQVITHWRGLTEQDGRRLLISEKLSATLEGSNWAHAFYRST